MAHNSKPLAVALLSGGMDSTVCVAWAIEQGFEVAALHLNYGQRTQQRELQAFEAVISHYGIDKSLVVDVSHLAAIGGSSLTDSTIDIPQADLQHSQAIPNTYVPFRNANILAIATSWAEVLQAKAIVIGAVEEDGSGYPDCRRAFFDAFEQTIALGTGISDGIKILTPIIQSSKADIVAQALRLQVPLHLTWSCYRNEDLACGHCDSCALRLRGFARCGINDPLPYIERPLYI